MEHDYALVYRLLYTVVGGYEISPGHIWGTVEAINAMGNSKPVYATERQVLRRDLDAAGFLYEQVYACIKDVEAPQAIRT